MAAKVGDIVEVPGGMSGTVKFVGSVDGKKGTFAGVQLATEFAARGKNSGEVEGKHYFRTTIPGSGIFLPVERAVKRAGAATPGTPKTPGLSNFNQGGRTPLAALPKPNFSQTVGPGARAASPVLKAPGRRESLPRPSSPLRKGQIPSVPKLTTPKTRPSIGLAKSTAGNGSQYRGSPSLSMKNGKFSQSLRQSAITPSKKTLSPLGPEASFDEESDSTPVPTPVPASKTIDSSVRDEEIKRLRDSLQRRDAQLKEQASSIADMEKSLTELQSMLPDQPPSYTEAPPPRSGGGSTSQEVGQLRDALREKNEKIKTLTAEFDANRADFRSTIDTLELASSETERVYEKRVDELLEEVRSLQDREGDVEGVSQQFKQLEELVQELEEGLEEARRGEAEARGEVEFLRGEVERSRSELRREREKKRTERALNGDPEEDDDDDEQGELLSQVAQKDDEIRGLKAIIHSLNQGTPGAANGYTNGNGVHLPTNSHLHQQIKTLETLLEQKSDREDELVREITRLQSANAAANLHRFPQPPFHRKNTSLTPSDKHRSAGTQRSANSNRLSDRTVVPTAESRPTWHDANEDVPVGIPTSPAKLARVHEDDHDSNSESEAGRGVDASVRSEASSGALWCEICEIGGHDILTCKAMFGANAERNMSTTESTRVSSESQRSRRNAVPEGVKDLGEVRGEEDDGRDSALPAPLASRKSSNNVTPRAAPPMPNPMDTVGMVAGRDSGVVDVDKWCALCERDGHESVDCPFEAAF